ncbi:hypothetical protein JCM15457_1787 [Liquorilactobacillus sucicola DSM 21376 = JCM 15457]|uniref:Gram-positive cocci surface proteins LPxTG domain-containing protein n=1 Tax=Liquorilactobacillus sucicola DSM 21376 = JCM 15457 TaxID=1423806 RepID=A0A023CZ32_9LACO|nr:SEC10/PgrA surface exclusion domain-containing protein [Liquorilactobacillus sucicola]KRN07535.1 hypothetical protein FD15_GL000818 [Liquorilactobacillus sucicola DSM 21376 = JCM 15457]GAJ26836.1 hypothetical protein JCM15457_1787 [Liquorilactobacillus sucicola DSM 21376 = JCM 15457]
MVKKGMANSKKLVALTVMSGAVGVAAFNSNTLNVNADTALKDSNSSSSVQVSSQNDVAEKKQQAIDNVSQAQTDYSQAQGETSSAKAVADSTSATQSAAQNKVDQANSSVSSAQVTVDTAKANESSAEAAQSKAKAAATAANGQSIAEQQTIVDQAHAQTQSDTQAAKDAQVKADSQAAIVSAASSSVAVASSAVNDAQQNVNNKQSKLNNIQGVDVTKARQGVKDAQTTVNNNLKEVDDDSDAQTQLNQQVSDAQDTKNAADTKLEKHNQQVSDAKTDVNTAQSKVDTDQKNSSDTQKQLDSANAQLSKHGTQQTITVPSDLATKLKNYDSTGTYSNSQEDQDAYKKNQYVASDSDDVKFDATAEMSDAQRNYYNLYVIDLINQARTQVGRKPIVASELAKNFAHQVSDNYTAEKYGFAHDGEMLVKTSNDMNAGWTGENISWSGAYSLLNGLPDDFPDGYTVNDFKRDIYNAVNGMLLDDSESLYGHAINFLNPDVYSFGFSYRVGTDGQLILNFDGILNQSTVITDDTAALKEQVAQLKSKLQSQQAITQTDQASMAAAVAKLNALQNDNAQKAVDDATAALTDAQNAAAANQQKLVQDQSELVSAQNELSGAQIRLDNALKSQQEKQAEIAEAKADLESAETALANVKMVFAAKQNDLESAKSELSAVQANVVRLTAKVALDKKAETAAQDKLNAYLNAAKNLAAANDKLAQAKTGVKQAETALTQAKAQLADAKTALEQAKFNNANAQKAYAAAAVNEQVKKTALTNAKNALNKVVAQEQAEQAVKKAEQKTKEADAKADQSNQSAGDTISGQNAQTTVPSQDKNVVSDGNRAVPTNLSNDSSSDGKINFEDPTVQPFVKILKEHGYSDKAIVQILKKNTKMDVLEKIAPNDVAENDFKTHTNSVKGAENNVNSRSANKIVRLKEQRAYPQTGEATKPFVKVLGLLISVFSMVLIFRSRKAKHFIR